MNVIDTYNGDRQALNDLMNGFIGVGAKVDLADGIYVKEGDSLAAVVMRGRYVSELELFNEYGDSYM